MHGKSMFFIEVLDELGLLAVNKVVVEKSLGIYVNFGGSSLKPIWELLGIFNFTSGFSPSKLLY
jgi:hypothetical protein